MRDIRRVQDVAAIIDEAHLQIVRAHGGHGEAGETRAKFGLGDFANGRWY